VNSPRQGKPSQSRKAKKEANTARAKLPKLTLHKWQGGENQPVGRKREPLGPVPSTVEDPVVDSEQVCYVQAATVEEVTKGVYYEPQGTTYLSTNQHCKDRRLNDKSGSRYTACEVVSLDSTLEDNANLVLHNLGSRRARQAYST
jgi:hypothetical protein